MNRNFSLIALVAVVCVAAGLRLANLGNVNSRTPDERVYTYQAKTWIESGKTGLVSMVAEYKADAETRLYPPPTRVGMIRLLAALMRWTGHDDESVGARISCTASIGSLVVLAMVGFRFLPPWAAVAGLMFYAVLPAELAISRRTWTDALVELAGLLLIWFVCEIAGGSRNRIWYPLMALVGSAALLVKESVPVPYGLCAVWVLWILAGRSDKKNASILLGSTAVGMGLAVWWLGDQVGSLSDYLSIVAAIPKVNAANPYALEYASGPAYLMLVAFWIVAPVTSCFGVVGLIAVWRAPRREPLMGLAGFSVAFLAIAMAMPHWLNLRYVGNTYGPVCLLAGFGCWYVWEQASKGLEAGNRRVLAAIAVVLVLGAVAGDYLRFRRYFVRDEMVDLSIKMLLDERGQ